MSTSTSAGPDAAGPIMQVLLDDPRLAGYYHFDAMPERLPLEVVDAAGLALDDARLTAAGEPVVVVDQSDRALTIRAMRIEGSAAEVSFAYPPEGIAGLAVLSQTAGAWVVDDLTITEN